MSHSEHFATFTSSEVRFSIHDQAYLGGWIPAHACDALDDVCLYLALQSLDINPAHHIVFACVDSHGYISALCNSSSLAPKHQRCMHVSFCHAQTDEPFTLRGLISSEDTLSDPIRCTLRVYESSHYPSDTASDQAGVQAQYQASFDPITGMFNGELQTHQLTDHVRIEDLCALLIYDYYLAQHDSKLELAQHAFADLVKDFDPHAEAHRLKQVMYATSSDEPRQLSDLNLNFREVLAVFEPGRRTHELWSDLASLGKRARSTNHDQVSDVLTYALVQYDELFGACSPNNLPVLRAFGHGPIQSVDFLIDKDSIEGDIVSYDYFANYRPSDSHQQDEDLSNDLDDQLPFEQNQTFMDHVLTLMSRNAPSDEEHPFNLEILDPRDASEEEARQIVARYTKFYVRLNALFSCLAQRFGKESPQATYPSLTLLSEVDQELEAIEVETMLAQHEESGFSPIMTIPCTRFTTSTGVFYNVWEHLSELNLDVAELSTRTLGLTQEIVRLRPQLINESLPVVICSDLPSYAQILLTVPQHVPSVRAYHATQGWQDLTKRKDASKTLGYRHAFMYAYQILKHNKAVDTVQVRIEEMPDALGYYIAKEQAKRYAVEALQDIDISQFKVDVITPDQVLDHKDQTPRYLDTLVITREIVEHAVQACIHAPARSHIDQLLMDHLQSARVTLHDIDEETHNEPHRAIDFPHIPAHSRLVRSEFLYDAPLIPWLVMIKHLAEHEHQGLLPALDACRSTQERVHVLLDIQKHVKNDIIGALLQSAIQALIAGEFETESSEEIYAYLAFTTQLNDNLSDIMELLFLEEYDACLKRCQPMIQLIYDRFSLEDTESYIWRSFKNPADTLLYQCDIAKPGVHIYAVPKICIDYLQLYATLLLRTNQVKQARLQLEQLVRIAPAEVEGILQLAYIYEQNDELNAMQQLITDHIPYIHESEGAGLCYYRLAYTLYKQGLFDASIAAYLLSTGLCHRRRHAGLTELAQLFDIQDIKRMEAELTAEKLQELGVPIITAYDHCSELLILAHRLILKQQFDAAAQAFQGLNGTYRCSTLDLLSQTYHLTQTLGVQE